MRPPSQRYLPPIAIQVFGGLIVTVVTVAGILGIGNPTLLIAVLGVASAFVLLNGFYEKIKYDVAKAVAPPEDERAGDGR